jgi:hypothetical protein
VDADGNPLMLTQSGDDVSWRVKGLNDTGKHLCSHNCGSVGCAAALAEVMSCDPCVEVLGAGQRVGGASDPPVDAWNEDDDFEAGDAGDYTGKPLCMCCSAFRNSSHMRPRTLCCNVVCFLQAGGIGA